MKVQVQFLVKNLSGDHELGRTAWIGRDEDKNLTFSTIYTTEATAIDITRDELESLELIQQDGGFKIIKVVGDVVADYKHSIIMCQIESYKRQYFNLTNEVLELAEEAEDNASDIEFIQERIATVKRRWLSFCKDHGV